MFQVIVALWILSEIGELCDLLRFMYIGMGFYAPKTLF
jgi:hypothetical protein